MKKLFALLIMVLFLPILGSCTKNDTKAAQTQAVISTITQAQAPAQPQALAPTPIKNIKVTANEINIRQDKSTNSTIIAKAYRGDVFQILGEAKDAQSRVWYKVEADFGDVTGWLAGWFCEKTSEDANRLFKSKPGELLNCSSKDLYIKLLLLGDYSADNLIKTFGKDYTIKTDNIDNKDYEYKNGVKFRVNMNGEVVEAGVDNRSFYIDWVERKKATCDIFSKNKGNEQIITDSGNVIVVDEATKKVLREYFTDYSDLSVILTGNFMGDSALELYISDSDNDKDSEPTKRAIYKVVNDDFVRVYNEDAFGQYKEGIKSLLEKETLKLDVNIGSTTENKKSAIPERVFYNTKAVTDKNKLLSVGHVWTVEQENGKWYVRVRYSVNYPMLTYYWGPPLLEKVEDNMTMYNDLARVDVMLDLFSEAPTVYKADSKVKYDNSELNNVKPLLFEEAALQNGPKLEMSMKEAYASLGGKLKEPNYSEKLEYKGVSLCEYCGVIVDIYSESKDYTTTRGLKVGDSIEKVESLYGKPDIGFSEDEMVQYKLYSKYRNKLEASYYRTMTITYENGLVEGIQFHQVIFD